MYTPAATPISTLWSVARELWRHFIAVVLYVSVIEGLDIRYDWKDNAFPLPVIAIMGTVIGLLLAFRTNSCYGRWWEARILWGAIVNDSRTWTRQLLEFTASTGTECQTTLTRMCHRQIAWCYALSRGLRGQEATQDLGNLLAEEEICEIREKHLPNLLLLRQGQELRALRQQGHLETLEFVELEKTLLRLTNAMGGCEANPQYHLSPILYPDDQFTDLLVCHLPSLWPRRPAMVRPGFDIHQFRSCIFDG